MLRDELARAVIASDAGVPSNVITMWTRVSAGQSGQYDNHTLVYPWEADVGSSQVSVLAPLGTALLGNREDDHIEWRMPGGVGQLRVERILLQSILSQGEPRLSWWPLSSRGRK